MYEETYTKDTAPTLELTVKSYVTVTIWDREVPCLLQSIAQVTTLAKQAGYSVMPKDVDIHENKIGDKYRATLALVTYDKQEVAGMLKIQDVLRTMHKPVS